MLCWSFLTHLTQSVVLTPSFYRATHFLFMFKESLSIDRWCDWEKVRNNFDKVFNFADWSVLMKGCWGWGWECDQSSQCWICLQLVLFAHSQLEPSNNWSYTCWESTTRALYVCSVWRGRDGLMSSPVNHPTMNITISLILVWLKQDQWKEMNKNNFSRNKRDKKERKRDCWLPRDWNQRRKLEDSATPWPVSTVQIIPGLVVVISRTDTWCPSMVMTTASCARLVVRHLIMKSNHIILVAGARSQCSCSHCLPSRWSAVPPVWCPVSRLL